MSNKYESLSVMISKQMKIFTDAKIVSQQNWRNALPAAAEVHLVSLVARQIMKMDLKIVHAWRAVLRDVPVLNGTAATFHFTCSDLIKNRLLAKCQFLKFDQETDTDRTSPSNPG